MSSPIFSTQDNPPPQPWPPTPSYPGPEKATSDSERAFSLLELAEENAFKDDPIGHALKTLKKLRLDSYKKGIYIPPLAKAGLQAKDDAVLPLMKTVQDFLAGNGQVMLILGDSGAGKSTFNRHLEHQLWEDYSPGGAIPLFINLPALDRPEKLLVVEHLRTLDFSEKQIQELKQQRHFVLICDGYDECQLTRNLHTTNLFNQPGQWSVKLVVTCRTQYLGKDYNDLFVPMAPGQYFRSATDRFQEAVLAPFTSDQIEDYVERYVRLEPRTWVKNDYMDKLMVIPGLLDLVKNPFLLTLCLEALPSVVEGKADLFKLRVTRVQLYDHFVVNWLGVNKRRLLNQKLSTDDQTAYTDLKDDGFEQSAVDFQKNLAAAIFTHQDGRPVVDYTPKNDRNSWKADFFSPEPQITLLRAASLISRMGNKYRFIHRSVLEYFYSCTVCPPPAIDNEFALQGSPESASSPPSISDHPLSRRNLVAEPSIVQFLAQRAQMNPEFKRQLDALLELSKTDEQASQAAANAITILVRAGVQFNGTDLRGIKIPRADLSDGQFDSAQFQEANLTGVNFAKSWIRQADFSNARMDGVQFGELPYLVEYSEVRACAFSPDGGSFAVGLNNGNINIYDTTTWTRTHVLNGHHDLITSLAYSPSSHRLLSGSEDKTVRLWNYPTWSCDIILEEHTKEVTAVAFSPSGRQFASASDDKSVRLWDSETRSLAAVLEHDSKVINLAYSPDGLTIISGSDDGAIRTFDAQSGTGGSNPGRGREPVKEGRPERISCIAFSPDGQWILSGFRMGTLQLCKVGSCTLRYSWEGHSGSVSSVTFSANGQWIASASQDRTVKLWNAQTRTLVSALTGHMAPVTHIAFSNRDSHLASCGRDMTVRLWEVSPTITGLDYHDSIGSFTSVAYSPDGRHFVYGCNDGSIQRYDEVTGQSSLVLPPGSYRNGGIVFSTDGLQIATCVIGGSFKIWSVETEQESFVLRGDEDNVHAVPPRLHGDWVAAGTDDKKAVRIWNIYSECYEQHASAKVIRICRVCPTDLTTKLLFSLDGRHVVSCNNYKSTEEWDVNHSPSLWTKSYCWLPNTPLTVITHGDPEILIRDDQTGEHTILPHERNVHTFGVSLCGQWIAAGCENYIYLWHSYSSDKLHTWERVGAVPNFFERVRAIVWKPNALEFVVSCEGGSARAWRFQEELGQVSAILAWSIGSTGFEVSGAVITDTNGLSRNNQRLLKQRGAIDESPSSSGLEYQGTPDALTQSDPLEASDISDMEGWHWEEEGEDDEDEEGQEGEDDEEEEEQEEDDE